MACFCFRAPCNCEGLVLPPASVPGPSSPVELAGISPDIKRQIVGQVIAALIVLALVRLLR